MEDSDELPAEFCTLRRVSTKEFLNALGGWNIKQRLRVGLKLLDQKRCVTKVERDMLVDLIWGDRADGGPINPGNAIGVMFVRFRDQGIPVTTNYPPRKRRQNARVVHTSAGSSSGVVFPGALDLGPPAGAGGAEGAERGGN